jgi:DNA helicase-2/ATP-dependent DNA helicase PcrA
LPTARLSAAVEEVVEDDVTPEVSSFETTEHHDRIFEAFREGSGHLRVEAYAGTGKTTTILRAIDLAPEDAIWLATFGKRNQEELDGRVTNPRATARTIHSLGKGAITENWGYVKVANRFDREDDLAAQVTAGMPYGAKRLVGKLCTKARELAPFATFQDVVDIALDFDLAPPAGDGLSVEAVARATMAAMDIAAKVKPIKTGIDFADMLYLPMRNGWLKPQFDLVVVDEYQDLTLAQLLFCRKVCHSYGRIVLVGDKHQAIYAFRGAGGSEVAKLMANLQPEELKLPKTYRCPRKVVAIAEPFAPGYTVDESAPEGIVDQLAVEKLVETAQAGDFILSRANAPLMPVALALLRADKPATIRGRDIARGLVSLVKRLATGDAKHSIPAFLNKVRTWRLKETDRAVNMKRDDLIPGIEDKAETLNCLAGSSTSVPHLLTRLDTLFTDSATEGVVLSTVHKVKGLEADRVFILRKTFLRPTPCRCGHQHNGPCRRCVNCPEMRVDSEKVQEERNLMYVAVTRAKQHLTMVV